MDIATTKAIKQIIKPPTFNGTANQDKKKDKHALMWLSSESRGIS